MNNLIFFKNWWKSVDKYKLFILVFFTIVYASISLVNHYNFRTFAWDLGINNNAIYDYAHFRWNDCMLMQPQFNNLLSDHFSLFPILFSPFILIFGSYTLLIAQIFFIILGGLGVYKYFAIDGDDPKNDWFPKLAMIHFFSIWGIYSALAFDYHDNVIAAMLIPWFFYYFKTEKTILTLLVLCLILVTKENMALWAGFICIGLMVKNFRNKKQRNLAIIYSLFSFFIFIILIKVVMPALANVGREYLHFKYSSLGTNFSEAFTTILTRPIYVLKLLFKNNLNNPDGDGIKFELHYVVLLSGGILLLLRPYYFIMLVPIYAQKLFNDDFTKWGLNYQYCIEFVPILTLGVFDVIKNNQRIKRNYQLIGLIVVLSAIAVNIKTMDSRVSKWYTSEQYRFYSPQHYQTNFNIPEINKALNNIPFNAKVSASSSIVPHLALRDYIYQYPDVYNANYIILLSNDNYYPLSKEEYFNKLQQLQQNKLWEKLYDYNKLIIYRKK